MTDSPVYLNIDIETLGVRPSSIVLSLACVPFRIDEDKSFEEYVKDGFSVKFCKHDQRNKWKRTVDQSTIEWWKKQSSDARSVYEDSDEDMLMEDGLVELSKYVQESPYRFDRKSFVFCRGNYFDFPMIESMYYQVGKNLPFNSWMFRDIRTYMDVLTGSTDGYGIKYKDMNIPGFIAHNCLHDTCADIMRMKAVYKDVFE